MSGGSFDYLYYHLEDEPLNETNLSTLLEMIGMLEEQGQGEAAEELRQLHQYLQDVTEGIKSKLNPALLRIIKGAEWWQSGDWGRETFDKAWREYKAQKV